MKRSTLCLIVIIYSFCRLLNNPLLTKHLVFPAHRSEGLIDHKQNGTQSQEIAILFKVTWSFRDTSQNTIE